jgi:hypothetical protein
MFLDLYSGSFCRRHRFLYPGAALFRRVSAAQRYATPAGQLEILADLAVGYLPLGGGESCFPNMDPSRKESGVGLGEL